MICIPKLVQEIQDLLLPATVLLPRLDDCLKKSMLFSKFRDVTKGLLGNPYQISRKSMVSHELTSFMQQALISKPFTPWDWSKTHPKSVPSSFLGAITPTRVNAGNGRFSRQANCWSKWNPKRMYKLTLMTSSASLEAVLRTKQIALGDSH